jgi:hypothetical protein
MALKIYSKLGKLNYKEKKLVSQLQEVFAKKLEENPSFTIEPATNYNELQNMFYQYGVDDAKFEDIKPEKGGKTESTKETSSPFDDDDDTFVDPMNREEPIVRDYVMNNEFGGGASTSTTTQQTEFGEPMSFEESFQFPTEEPTENGGGQRGQATNQNQNVEKRPKQAPINPEFDEMSNGRKRKSTKKFAKYIVSAVAMLQERGFEWYATKDINEPKLLEYELNNEMDLSLLLSLEDGQNITVKQFFLSQCEVAKQLSKIDEGKLQDLSEVLAEVMMEKGVAPTPQQELMLIGGSILAEQVLKMIAFNSQIKGVLNQLRDMNSGNKANTPPPPQPQYTPPQPERKEPEPKPEPITYTEEPVATQPQEGDFDELELMILNSPIETKE